ncbi:hypothetical protein GCM10027299_49170 [Larkinella ripae]
MLLLAAVDFLPKQAGHIIQKCYLYKGLAKTLPAYDGNALFVQANFIQPTDVAGKNSVLKDLNWLNILLKKLLKNNYSFWSAVFDIDYISS